MQNKIENKQITVWFSCGAASAVAAKQTLEKYGEYNQVRVVNNPIKEEHEDNQRFLKDVEQWIGKKIEFATNPKFPDQSCETVWKARQFMSGPLGAPCTTHLKKHARQYWETNNNSDYLVLGFTADEKKRAERFVKTEQSKLIPILVDENITKENCFEILLQAGLELPKIYSFGYPNANCIGCVKATSPTYWNLVRKTFPDVFKSRSEQSFEIGAKLARYKGERIFLKDLPENAKGRDLKNYNFECGIFCGEKL
tara:strand:+ start:459 stop:1220 length:762 start_codon:yes stop_codon:yes gene_type:complete